MMNRILLFFLLSTIGLSSIAQKKELIEDRDLIIERAQAEIDLAMKAPEGSIYLYTLKNPIKGEYTFDKIQLQSTERQELQVQAHFCI